jgi:hypothetical protein
MDEHDARVGARCPGLSTAPILDDDTLVLAGYIISQTPTDSA